jgi:hypothetical protein
MWYDLGMGKKRRQYPKKEASMDSPFVEKQYRCWLSTAIEIGEWLIGNSFMPRQEHGIVPDKNEADDWFRRKFAYEHFLLISISKALEWGKKLGQSVPTKRPIIAALSAKLPKVKELRNMREHDLEYFEGRGREQAKFNDKSELNGIRVVVDASSTCVFGSKYLIGGRLDVKVVVNSAREALDQLNMKPPR